MLGLTLSVAVMAVTVGWLLADSALMAGLESIAAAADVADGPDSGVGTSMVSVQAALGSDGGDGHGDGRGVVGLPVATIPARLAEGYTIEQAYTGRAVARQRASLAFEVAGRVAEVMVDDGSSVEAGQPLARLETDRLEAQRDRVLASLAASRALLVELETGPRVERIDRARAAVAEAEARRKRAALRLDRVAELRSDEAATRDELDEARFEAEAATAAWEGARESLAELLNGTRSERIAAQRAEVDRLAAELHAIEIDLADAVLTAPWAGVVQRRRADPGDTVSADTPVLELIETGRIEARIGLPPRVAQTLGRGESYTVAAGRLDEGIEARATLRAVLPGLDVQTNTAEAVLEIDAGSAARFADGRVVRLKLDRRVWERGFWLPAGSLTRGVRGLWSCYVVDDEERVRRVEVEVLHDAGNRLYVRGPLSEGRAVITGNLERLVPGQRVRVVGSSSGE